MDQISSVDCITLVLRQPWEGFVPYSGFSCEKKTFWPYSALGALFGRRRSEIKVLQVSPLSVPHQRSHFDATVHFIWLFLAQPQKDTDIHKGMLL